MAVPLTDQILQETLDVLEEFAGVIPPAATLRAMLDADPALKHDVSSWGAEDTDIRDRVCDAAANHLVGRAWPTSDDRAEMEAFHEQLVRAARRDGWEVADWVADRA